MLISLEELEKYAFDVSVRAKELIFPINNIKTKQNIHNIRLENGRKLFIESNDKSGNLKLLLSTGEMEAYFLPPYYEKHFNKFANENMILQNKGSNVQNIDDVLRVLISNSVLRGIM